MGSGSLGFLLAWRPGGAAVLAADIGTLIQNPAVLLGAAAVVVVAVLIVLIMVLRGGSRKAEMAPELDEEQEHWEAAPRGNASPSGKGYDPRDQMLPWEQGGARQQMSGRRGPGGRDAQAGWGPAERDAQWEAQGQSAPRGGQWVGTDEWVPSEPAMGRGRPDSRAQDQMGSPGNDGWAWGAGQAPSGGQNNQWGQGAAPPMGRADDQWGQGASASHPTGRDSDQWGQGAGAPYPTGRGADQWGQGAATSQPLGRDNDQWGQGAPMRGRGQDQWGDQSGAGAPGMGQAEDHGFAPRGGPRGGAAPASQAEGQWGQGGWDQANGGWGAGESPDRWGQAASPAQPGASRPSGQGGMAGLGNQSQPSQGPGNGWGEREASAWQVEPRREQPSWEAPDWRSGQPEPADPRSGSGNQAPSRASREQTARGPSGGGWDGAGSAGEWGQADPNSRPGSSRPIEPAGARGVSQPSSSGGEWGNRGFDGPTAKPAPQPGSWEQRETPSWQSPGPQMAAPSGQVNPPPERTGPDMRQLNKVNPESTAYAPQTSESSEGAADKTVVMRKDTGTAARTPSVVVRQGKEPGRTYDMRKDHVSIGRSRESDIFLEDLAVSRLHATIYRDEMGGYLLRDENSANGTSVNGQRVSECALQEGDEIQLGQTILAFVRR
ncbi:MAG TPA: FHA domain-containing protein [Ktedonobacterales bacterium]